MYISARADYALRTLVALAVADRPMKAEELATSQGLPPTYLRVVLVQLRRAGLVANPRGRAAGYRLVNDPGSVTAADAIRAVDGILADVPELRPGSSAGLSPVQSPIYDLWLSVQASLEETLDRVTIEQLAGAHRQALEHNVPDVIA